MSRNIMPNSTAGIGTSTMTINGRAGFLAN